MRCVLKIYYNCLAGMTDKEHERYLGEEQQLLSNRDIITKFQFDDIDWSKMRLYPRMEDGVYRLFDMRTGRLYTYLISEGVWRCGL